MFRSLSLVVAVLALVCFVAAPALAEKADTHDGTFVKADDKTLTMKGKGDKEHSHALAKDVKVTLDGKEAKLADIKAGTKIKVPIADKKATKIEATTK